ncbi:hypothetical protein [Massilia pseudoviolaceinigra]|uniref:hypothetical protein n=1 Tax=Massilia pseudoviolaceinigra TaxID=3057165 RepID=UPI0027967329|nr:hypothetical protein [Massilia sp. CCM 9206]MDQ1924569.1 hypothetical protein [Massilia sp. CCM 9206]
MADQFLQLPEIRNTAGASVQPILALRDGHKDFIVLVQSNDGEWDFAIELLVSTLLDGDDLNLGIDGDDSRGMTIAADEIRKLTKFVFDGWRHHGLMFTLKVEWDFLMPHVAITALRQ